MISVRYHEAGYDGIFNLKPEWVELMSENQRARLLPKAEWFIALAMWGAFGGPVPRPPCDRSLRDIESPVRHAYKVVDEEYDSLANGGSYWVLECVRCGRRAYEMMPD